MGVLLTAITVGGLTVEGITFALSLLTRKIWFRNFVVGSVAVWLVFYFVMLFGFSFASKEKDLALNEPKQSCGESFEKEIVFGLPADTNDPRLDIREGYCIDSRH